MGEKAFLFDRIATVYGVNIPRVNPTMPSTDNKLGADLRNALPAILKAFFVFSLLLIKEATRPTPNKQ